MKILYVTRHFNHSGYEILDRLIRENVKIDAILLHDDKSSWRKPYVRQWLILKYKLKCWYYRCKPLRTLRSEEALAKRHNIPIIWADSIKSDAFYEELTKLNPDIIVLGGGWHELIPPRVFSFPSLGCINTHPSLLPEFRGTSITRWQVLYGVEKSGSTIHYVDETFDTGGVLAQAETIVGPHTSPQELFLQLGKVGADIMIPLLRKFSESGKPTPYFVHHNEAYYQYFKRWTWDLERLKIDWSKTLRQIHYMVLANTQESYEYLGPTFRYNGHSYFLRTTRLIELSPQEQHHVNQLPTGKLMVLKIQDNKVVVVRNGDQYALELNLIQRFDKYYKYRRAYLANRLLKLTPGQLFEV
ncbi:MAG TPA: formyltransferase family protein [Flavobacteriales bacterium]